MILFHGTDALFDAFSSDWLNSHEDRHANGNLGVWVTTNFELASRFGKYVLAVETDGDQMFDMDVSDLIKMASKLSSPEDYRELSAWLRREGYHVIAVRETDGSAPTRVLIDPEGTRIVGRALVGDNEQMRIVAEMATEVDDFAYRL